MDRAFVPFCNALLELGITSSGCCIDSYIHVNGLGAHVRDALTAMGRRLPVPFRLGWTLGGPRAAHERVSTSLWWDVPNPPGRRLALAVDSGVLDAAEEIAGWSLGDDATTPQGRFLEEVRDTIREAESAGRGPGEWRDPPSRGEEHSNWCRSRYPTEISVREFPPGRWIFSVGGGDVSGGEPTLVVQGTSFTRLVEAGRRELHDVVGKPAASFSRPLVNSGLQ